VLVACVLTFVSGAMLGTTWERRIAEEWRALTACPPNDWKYSVCVPAGKYVRTNCLKDWP